MEPSPHEVVARYFYRSFRIVRIWMIIALILYAVFGVLDDYMLPLSKVNVWIVRYVFVVPILSILIILSFTIKQNLKYLQIIVLAFVMTGVAGLCMTLSLFQPTERAFNLYFVGLLAAMTWSQVVGFTHRMYVFIAIGIISMYNIVAIFFQQMPDRDLPLYLFSNLFFITFGAFGWFSSKTLQKFILDDHNKTMELDREKAVLLEKQSELSQINTFKTKLLSIMSNDVRTPLHNVRDLINLHADESVSRSEFLSKSKLTLSAIGSLELLLDTTLVWSLCQSRSYTLNKITVNLQKAVNESFEFLTLQAEEKHVALQNEVMPDVVVTTDKNALGIILKNLIFSLLRTLDGKTVRVAAHRNTDIVEVVIESITDGSGAVTYEEHIISMEEANNESRTSFGLKVAFELIHLHGGVLSRLIKDDVCRFYFTVPSPVGRGVQYSSLSA